MPFIMKGYREPRIGADEKAILPFIIKGYGQILSIDVSRGLYRRKSVNYIKVLANPQRVGGRGRAMGG